MRLSVIVPVYNEERTVIDVLRAIRANPVEGVQTEVVVVDDGSTDGSRAALEALPELYDILIRQENGGKGAAVIAALKAATGDYILFQDADLEYSPSEYSALLFPVREFGAEIVVGSRFMAPRYSRVQYFSHKLGNRAITLIFNLFFNTTFSDIYSCYLLYRRELVRVDELVSRGWEQHAEILCRAVRRAKVVYEVPISYHGRSFEEGKKIRGWHVIAVLSMIVRRRVVG